MTVWLTAFKLSEPGPSGDKYALTVQNPDSKDLGLSKTPLWEHSFPTIGAVTQFLVASRVAVVISELELRLNEEKSYSLEISTEDAIQMGFKLKK